MADQKPTENNFEMLGGINTKISDYSSNKKQFQNIRNMDFDVPNALQKRPGSTQAISAGITGAVTSLHEFVRLDGASTIVAGTETAMWYLTGQTANLLDQGWSNGQPADMLTFVNKEFMANGAKFYGWSGVGSTPAPVGVVCATEGVSGPNSLQSASSADPVYYGGYPMQFFQGAGTTNVLSFAAAFIAYSYLGVNGQMGNLDLRSTARNIIRDLRVDFPGFEQFSSSWIVSGITYPSGQGITAIAIWVAFDAKSNFGSSIYAGSSIGLASWSNILSNSYAGITLIQTTSQSNIDNNFLFYTFIPTAGFGGTFFFNMATFTSFKNGYTSLAALTTGPYIPGKPFSYFSLSSFCWFNSNTPKYIEINQNVMFSSGFSNSPSVLWFSEVGQPENIQPDSSFEVRTNDGDKIYGTKTYNNNLLVFKQNSFHKVIGDSPENFELIELSTEYGCISNQAIVEYKELLVWLDQKGIVRYNGASWEIISTPVEEIFKRMNVEAAKDKACAFHNLYRNQIWFGIPVDGSTQNNITVVYDYLVDAWTYFDGFNPSSFALAKGGLSKATTYRGDYSGLIHYHGESFFGDNGRGITCLAMPNWDRNKPNETWIWRRFFLDVATATGLTGVITGKVMSDYDHTTVQATYTIYQNAFQSRAEMGVVAKAVTTEWAHYSASLPLLINNYAWAKRLLRNV